MLDTGLLRATVPTPGMLDGNFSPAELAKLGNITATGGASRDQLNADARWRCTPAASSRRRSSIQHAGLMKLYPAAQRRSQRHRRVQLRAGPDLQPEQYQWMSRVDYNISDNTKLFVRYNLQRETQLFPVGPVVAQRRTGSLSDSGRRARTAPIP